MSALIARQNEPTMDEILASIRKIISDDLGDTAEAVAGASVESKAEILELSNAMALPVAREPSWNISLSRRVNVVPETARESQAVPLAPSIDPVSAVTELAARMARELGVEQCAVAEDVVPVPLTSPVPVAVEQSGVIAPDTANAVSSAFGSLRENIEREATASAAVSSAMETVVEAALRPMLKDWIDAHLPAMVERLVKAEIERMAQKG